MTINVAEVLSVIAFFGLFFFVISYMGLRGDVRELESRIKDVETRLRGGKVDVMNRDYF